MARLEIVNSTSWKQPFKDRKREFKLWRAPTEVADYCELIDGTKRLLQIQFEDRHDIDIIDRFQITSGREVSFPKKLQDLIKPIILKNPESNFVVRVLDCEPKDGEIEPFPTTGLATINTRIGQAKFRKDVIDYWKECAVTGVGLVEILRASHIKPWSDSSDSERLDKYNGLLLIPALDSLFDLGFISFSDTGGMIVSPILSEFSSKLGLDSNKKLSCIEANHRKYLEYHREKIFKKSYQDKSSQRAKRARG